MGPECSIFIKRLAVKIAEKKNQSYPDVMRVIRTKLRYSILRTTLIAVRGTRGRPTCANKNGEQHDIDYNIISVHCERDQRD